MVKLAFKERVSNSCAAVVGSGKISNLSKLLCMSLFPARMKKFYSTMKTLRVVKTFLPLKGLGMLRCSKAAYSAVHGRNWQNFELMRYFMVVLLTCNNEKDSIKNGGARVFTTLYIDLSDARMPLTLQSVVRFGRISNSSVLLWLF